MCTIILVLTFDSFKKDMVYHSAWNGSEVAEICGTGVYPIKTKTSGPAPKMEKSSVNPETGESQDNEDIIDEILYTYKANSLFRSFPINGPADRLLIYVSAFIHQCIKRISASPGMTKEAARNAMLALAIESFSAPGSAHFPFGAFFPKPKSPEEVEKWIEYIRQIRMEVGNRVVSRCFAFPEKDGSANKLWLAFARTPFLNKAFEK